MADVRAQGALEGAGAVTGADFSQNPFDGDSAGSLSRNHAGVPNIRGQYNIPGQYTVNANRK